MGLEIAKLLATLVGAVLVVWYWNEKKHKLEQYRLVDEGYHDLLEAYFAHPAYGDEPKTAEYAQAFQGDEALRYHFFAMRVHTTMESLFDLSGGKIPDEWLPIFKYHTRLHGAWLQDHQQLHEPSYVARVFASAPQPA